MFVCEAGSMKQHWKTCGSGTCQIRPVIPTRVDLRPSKLGRSSRHANVNCVPTKCVHYASETSIELFWNPCRMNLRPMKPCAVIKGIEWLKKIAFLIQNLVLYAGTHPKAPIISYLLHHNSPGLSIHTDIAMFPMNIVR
jgi:hypothetical protein